MSEPVSLYVIAYNEGDNLRALLPTVSWADEVVVVDSFSTDDTPKVCADFDVRRVNVKFEGFGKLRNSALALLKHDWVVSIDSDERSTPEFADEVRRVLAAPKHAAYFVPRRNTFLGHPMRFSGMYPDYRQPQVFDRRKFRYREDPVHEGFECSGSIGYLKSFIWQHPWPTLEVIFSKGQRYSTLMAQRRFERGKHAGIVQLAFHPPAAFVKKFIFEQGFRDGTHGFLVAAQHACYTFMKYAKLWEMEQNRKKQ